MSSRRDLRVPFRALCGIALPLSAAAVIAQEAPAEAPPVHITQPPQQILPTGAEDAVPARVEDFAARSRSSEQSPEAVLRAMTSESTEGLETVRLPNGAIGIDLNGRFMSVAVAKQREDGTFEVSCHTGEDAFDHAHHAADILEGRSDKLKRLPPVTIVEPQPALEEK